MNREEARQTIRAEWRTLLPEILEEAKGKANGETSYICPVCGHGTHGDGLTYNPKGDGTMLHCFNCGSNFDVIEIYRTVYGVGYIEALTALASKLGIVIGDGEPFKKPAQKPNNSGAGKDGKTAQAKTENATQTATGEKIDNTEYYFKCYSRIADAEPAEYLKSRGISLETAGLFLIGYDPAADPAGSGYPSKRIIIPTSKQHYIARAIDANNKYKKLNPKDVPTALFNESALYNGAKAVFIVEGAFDALSIIEAGRTALALNSTTMVGKLIEKLKEKPTKATLILCLDNDTAGSRATQTLKTELQRLNIPLICYNICNGAKDANEALQKNREQFFNAVARAEAKAIKPDNTSLYIDELMRGDIARFRDAIPTGFSNIDEKTGGGLYEGLYCIGAISSLGKTTFALQLADNIASAGTDVLFFSLEQSRLELVTKSIARFTALADKDGATSSLSIRKGFLPLSVTNAMQKYKETVADRMNVIEGNFNCTASFIREYALNHIANTGNKPVIFIDYLQILQPETKENGRQQSIREAVDSTVTELKRLSREQGLTVFIISSFNRSNYLTPVDFESFKESGGIEYTCDAIWGLQLQCLNQKIFDKDKNIKEKREAVTNAKKANPRKVELKCLKNRNGVSTFSCYFDYYCNYDLFEICKLSELDFVLDDLKG